MRMTSASTITADKRGGSRRCGAWRAVVAAVAVVLAFLSMPVGRASADVTFNQRMLELVNADRVANGLAPLVSDPTLSAEAEDAPYNGCGFTVAGRAKDMGQRNYFSHSILGCATQTVFNILKATGLVYSGSGENIAWMNGTIDPLVAASNLHSQLMGSPGHRANILNPSYTHVGFGSWTTTPGQTWSGGGYPLTNVWITAEVFAQMPVSASPAVGVSPSSLGFGDRGVGTSGPTQTVTVKNTGSAALAISSTSVTGANAADFPVGSNTCGQSLAAGASCAVAVGFTPGAAGPRSGTLSISDNAPGSPHAVALAGSGTALALTGAPVNVVATGGDGQLAVTWGSAPSGPSPVGYGVFVYNGSTYTGKSIWACDTCASAVVAGLPNGKQYHAVVYGHNGAMWGGAGISDDAWVLAVPAPPTNIQALPGDASLTLAWQAPTNPGTGIDGYGVFVYGAQGYTGKMAWVCASCTRATVSGLSNGVSYYAVVVAHNTNGWGTMDFSGWMGVGTPGQPGNVVAGKASGAVSATWTPAPNSGSAIVGYGVFVYDSSGYTGKSVWVCDTCTSATVGGLVNGTQYTVAVRAYNGFGWGVEGISNGVVPGT